MKKIGLTGGIGSGKSTIRKIFNEKNIPTIDTDILIHDLYTDLNNNYCKKVIDYFGNDIIDNEKNIINRKVLGSKVNDNNNKILMNMLFNYIEEKLNEFYYKNKDQPLVIVEMPVLFESKYDKFDKIITIDVPKEIQIERIKIRNPNMSDTDIHKFLKLQVSREYRIENSDFVINNYLNNNLENDINNVIDTIKKPKLKP